MKLNNKFILAALALIPHVIAAYDVKVANYTPFKLDIAVKYAGESKLLKSCLTDTFSLEPAKISSTEFEKTIKTPGICLVSGIEATIASSRGAPLTTDYSYKIGQMGGAFVVGYKNNKLYIAPFTDETTRTAHQELKQYYRQQEGQKQRGAEQQAKDEKAKEKQKTAAKDVNSIKNPQEFIEFASDASPREILGVDVSADDSTIGKAFRKLSIKFHPDKWPNDSAAATDAYQRIVNARDKLLGKR